MFRASRTPRQTNSRRGRSAAGACFSMFARMRGKDLLGLRVGVDRSRARVPVAGDRMFEKYRLRLDFPDQTRRNVEPGDERALPWPKRPGQHRHAHLDAEMDQRNDVEQVMAIVRLIGAGEEQMFAGYSGNAPESLLDRAGALSLPSGSGWSTTALTLGEEAVLERPQVRMAPNTALVREMSRPK